jgi:branched-chain amino acid transport system substrate-binding protein
MKFQKMSMGLALGAMLTTGIAASSAAQAEEGHYIPVFSYRTGAFAGSGIPQANGETDYFTMLNERDGGIGGVKVIVEECETGYKAQKGVECYEATKGKGALVYNPRSTGITLQLIPKAPIDKIPVLSMGYGLSAAAVGEKFPWVFNAPATYWSQASAVVKYIDQDLKGIKGKKIGFIYLDVGYGREPIPLLENLAEKMGFELIKLPVGVKEMQSQSSHWLQVRKERPDYMVMWGWGAMNPTAIKEAAKIRFPMDKFLGVWWSGSEGDVRPAGDAAKGYKSMSFNVPGIDFPVMQDILKYVVRKGKSQVKDEAEVGEVLYGRSVFNSMLVAEAIRDAQKATGKKTVTGADVRDALENLNLTEERLEKLGFGGFSKPIKITCKDHAGAHPMFVQQWDGKKWNKVSDWIEPMRDVVRPLLEEAAAKYVEDKKDWPTQKCAG